LVGKSSSYAIPLDPSKPDTYSVLTLPDLFFLADSISHLNNVNHFTNVLKEEVKKLFESDRENY